MHKYTFIEKYFHSQQDLLDLTRIDKPDVNSLLTYLNDLNSTAYKLKELFNCNVKDSPDFKLLQIIRNYFHHLDHVDETRLLVVEKNAAVNSSQQLLIPLETLSKSIKLFIHNSTVPEHNKQYKNKIRYVSKEMASISTCFSYCNEILSNMDMFCNKPSLKVDGVDYELGFDMFRFIYNVTNQIADKCRDIEELACKTVLKELDHRCSFCNNIEKIDMFCSADKMPISATQGMVFTKDLEFAM